MAALSVKRSIPSVVLPAMAYTEYSGCHRLYMRGFRFQLVSSAFGRTRVGLRPTELLVAREKKPLVPRVIRGGSARKATFSGFRHMKW